MSRFSTFNYLINFYCAGEKKAETIQIRFNDLDNAMKSDVLENEPSQKSIDAILNFASQYEVLKSAKTGNIELNLN